LPKVIWEQAASPPWWQSCRLQSFNRIYNVALMCTPPNTRFLGPHPCTHDPKRYLDRFTEVSKWPVKFGVRSDRLSVCLHANDRELWRRDWLDGDVLWGCPKNRVSDGIRISQQRAKLQRNNLAQCNVGLYRRMRHQPCKNSWTREPIELPLGMVNEWAMELCIRWRHWRAHWRYLVNTVDRLQTARL